MTTANPPASARQLQAWRALSARLSQPIPDHQTAERDAPHANGQRRVPNSGRGQSYVDR